jgi:DNA topoisomerase VI subunit B
MSRRAAARFNRTTLTTSRLLDFCSEKELTAQVGHPRRDWPLVIAKELIDNALDACEEAGVPPEITVRVDEHGITVTDYGPGIPPETVAGVLDFAVRVSSREHYVSPTRGAQGNALKTIVAMPFVMSGRQEGQVEIAARGIRHDITLRVDRIRQQPAIDHRQEPDRLVKNGSSVTVHWPEQASLPLTDARERFLQIAADFTFLNPHLTLTADWFGERSEVAATTPAWKKWLPAHPTDPHWYTPERFERLVCGYLAHDAINGRERTVRELVGEFHGLTGSAKQKAVLAETGLARLSLSAALRDGDELDAAKTAKLLAAMQRSVKPVQPRALGAIGKDHLTRRFEGLGCAMASFQYRKVEGVTDGLPAVVETAFAWRGDGGGSRRLIAGVNWSPGIVNPFRQLGRYGQSLDSVLQGQRAGHVEPVVLVLHLATPRAEYTDRGKSAVVIAGDEEE